MATAGIEAGLDDGLLAFYDFDSGFSDQLVKRNIDRYPPLELWRHEEPQPAQALDSLIKREADAASAEVILETNTFHRDNTGNTEINHADPYLVFPTLGEEITNVTESMGLPSISLFFKVDAQPDNPTRGTVDYRLFGEDIYLEYDGLLRVTQTWSTPSGQVSQSITFAGPLEPNKWHHIYWRLGRPGTPQKLFVNGIDRSQNVGGDMSADGFGKTGFAPLRNWMYNRSGTPKGKDLPDQYTLQRATIAEKFQGDNDAPNFATRYARYSRIMFFNTDLSVDQIKYLAAGSYLPWHPPPEWTPPANYLSLALNEAYLMITDSKIVEKTHAENNFSVDVWFKYAEQILSSREEAKPSWFARRTGNWALGITPAGNLIAQVTWHAADITRTETVKSFATLNSETWQRVTLTVHGTGHIDLHLGSQPLLVTVATVQGDDKTTYPVTNSSTLTLGSDSFTGELRSLVFYNPPQSESALRKSMYIPHMMTLPAGATCYLHLHNGSNPAGLIGKYPLTAMLPGDSGLLKPIVKHIDAQLNKGPEIGLSLSTQAGCFHEKTYIDCDTGVFAPAIKDYSVDMWFMIANDEHGEDDHDHDHVLFSIGLEVDDDAQFRFFNLTIRGNGELVVKYGTLFPVSSTAYQYAKGTIEYGKVGSDSWHHIALVLTHNQYRPGPIDWLVITCFLDGVQLRSDQGSPTIPAYTISNGRDAPHTLMQDFPLVIGATLGKDGVFYGVADKSKELIVDRGFNGYMRLFRVWSVALAAGEIGEMYDWSWQPDDMSNLLGYWSFELAQPLDYTEKNPTHASMRYYSQVVSQVVYPGTTDEPVASVPRTHPPHTTGKRMTIQPWVMLVADIIIIFVSILTPVRAKVGKLIEAVEKVFQNEKNAAVMFSKIRLLKLVVRSTTMSKSEKAKQIANAMIALFKWFYKSGLLMGLLRCFSFSIFGTLSFATLFIPIAGEAELALDLLLAAVGVESAFEDYERRMQELNKPPQLAITPYPTADSVVLKVGAKQKWEIFCDPGIQNEQQVEVHISCDQGLSGQQVLKLPDKLTFDRSTSKHDFEVEVLQKCFKPIRISFEREVFPDIVIDVHAFEFKLLPERPQLAWVDDNHFEVEFYVQLIGSLMPGDTVTWRPKLSNDFTYDVNQHVFALGKGATKPAKNIPPKKTIVKNVRPRAKTSKLKIELEGDGELVNDEGTVHLAAAKAEAAEKKVRERIFIYAMNAAAGDAQTIWVDRKEQTIDSNGVVTKTVKKSANTVIDGGYQWTAKPLKAVEQHGPLSKATIDLVIATHFDDDHVGGVAKLYEDLRATPGTVPTMTWIPDTRRPPPMPGPRLFAAAPVLDALMQPLTTGMEVLAMAFGPGDVITAEAVFPKSKRRAAYAADVVSYCKGQPGETSWDLNFVPTVIHRGATYNLADMEVKLLAPYVSDMQNHIERGYENSNTTNRLSIINTLNSTEYPFTSLWTGDAEDTSTGNPPYIGQTRAIGNMAMHFSVLKVSHHGSGKSGTQAWFALCTADVYIIGANGDDGNPRPNVLQWIINGHYAKARHNPGMVAPRIYVTNPFNNTSGLSHGVYSNNEINNLVYRGGATLYQRATSPANSRYTSTGYLRIAVEDGVFVGWPDEVDGTTPDTDARVTLVEEVTAGVLQTVN